ncbi:hypothetical protein CF319_g1014 [Tilletia indica]|nr:hypothetical protein CF319_g1014 [Tilletia indica]
MSLAHLSVPSTSSASHPNDIDNNTSAHHHPGSSAAPTGGLIQHHYNFTNPLAGGGSTAEAQAAASAALPVPGSGPTAASYLGIGSSLTPAADDSSFSLDLIAGITNSGINPSSSLHTHLGNDTSFANSSTGFNLGGPGGSSGVGTSNAIAGLDSSFLKVGGTTTFDFPSLPDGLLDEAPEYEYSAHTKANVFEAAQEYLADIDGARVFDLESFDPSLAGLGGDESLWSFAEGLDFSTASLPGHHQQHSQIAGPSSSSQFAVPDSLIMATSAVASASATPHLHSAVHHDDNQDKATGYGTHLAMSEGLTRPGTSSSATTPSGQYALNYLPHNAMSGTQTAPTYPSLFHSSHSNHMGTQLPSIDLGGIGDDHLPVSKRRRGMSPRTAPVYDESFGKNSPFQHQQQHHQQHQQQQHQHQQHQQHQQHHQSHPSFLPPPQHRGSNASPMPAQGHSGYPSPYIPFSQETKHMMYAPPPPAPQHHEGEVPSSAAAHVPYSRAHAPFPTTATPASNGSRSRMTSWQGSPYPGLSGHGTGGGGGEWGMEPPSHPGLTSSASYPSIIGPSPDPNHSGYLGHRLSEVSVASSSASAIGPGAGGGGSGSKAMANSVPSGGGYHNPGPAGLGIGPGGAANMGFVPIVGVPVGPGSTINLGPGSSNNQAEIIHSLGQALDATADADGVARCPFPNCNKTFAKNRTYNLKAHLRSHSQLKPFACASCPRAFSRKHDLERHARVHSGDKPYICEVCGRGFPRSDALRRHWRVEKECGQRAAEMEAQQAGSAMGGGNSSMNGEAGGSAHSDEDETSDTNNNNNTNHAPGGVTNSSSSSSNDSSSHPAYASHEAHQQQQQQQRIPIPNSGSGWFASQLQHGHPYQHPHQQHGGYPPGGPSAVGGEVAGEKRKR